MSNGKIKLFEKILEYYRPKVFAKKEEEGKKETYYLGKKKTVVFTSFPYPKPNKKEMKMNKWKTNEQGVIYKGITMMSKKEFLKILKKGVKLVEFEGVKKWMNLLVMGVEKK